jgi:hypothetical protein
MASSGVRRWPANLWRIFFKKIEDYLIDKEFQLSYIFISLLILLADFVSTILVVVVWNHTRFYQGYLLSPPPTEQLAAWALANNVRTDSMEFAFQYIAQAKPHSFYSIILYPILIIFAVNAVVIALTSLYISYKIAYPIHVLKDALRRKLEKGEIDKPLAVRNDNLFHELTSLANLAFFVAAHPEVKLGAPGDPQKSGKPGGAHGSEK